MSQQWEGKSKGTRLGYGIFISILKKFGVTPAYLLLYFVAGYYFLFSYKSSRHTWYFFRRRLQLPLLTSFRKLYSNYYWFGQAIIDRIVIMSGIRHRFSFNFDGEEHLHQMVAEGKGGILLSAHIGNWEIAGHLLKRLNTRINIVMFDGEHEKLKQYLENTTGQRNANIIVIRDTISHIYEITNALNNNEIICMHADRFLPGNKTLQIPFLDKAALFPAGPFVLAAKLKVPVSFVFAMKETKQHYHFFASAPVVYKDLPGTTPEVVLKDFAAAMELKARTYPDQWYNYYNFWRNETN